MSIFQVLGHTCWDESVRLKRNLLRNHAWIEDIPYFDFAVLEEGNEVWWSNLDLEYFAAPWNLSEFEIIDAIEIHIERIITSGHNKRLQEFVKDWTGIGLVILLFELVSYGLLTCCYNALSSNLSWAYCPVSLYISTSGRESLVIVSFALFLWLSSLSLSPPPVERRRLFILPQLKPCNRLCSLSTILSRFLLHVINLDVLCWISVLNQKDILIDCDTSIKNREFRRQILTWVHLRSLKKNFGYILKLSLCFAYCNKLEYFYGRCNVLLGTWLD